MPCSEADRGLGPFAEPLPSMRGRYLVQSPRLVRFLELGDLMLSIAPRRRGPLPGHIDRVLISNWGHLGDVVTIFGIIAALRAQFPGVFIGMIVGSWGLPAVAGEDIVDQCHVVDHPLLNRGGATRISKLKTYALSRRRAVRDIRRIGYQVAIDLNPHFPPAHPLFYAAGIRVRVGYDSGGFGALLSRRMPWADLDLPIAQQHVGLLEALDPLWSVPALKPRLARDTLVTLPAELGTEIPTIILHPGAGAPFKDWGLERWAELIEKLERDRSEFRLVLTGAGARETQVATELQARYPKLINLVGALDWRTFVSVVANANLVICPDTATGHVAGLFDVPTICLFTGVNNAAQWAPYADRVRVLVHPVVCAPCYRGAGCHAMACIRRVTTEQVMAAVSELCPRH